MSRARKSPVLARDAAPSASQQVLPFLEPAPPTRPLAPTAVQRLWFCVWLPGLPLEACRRSDEAMAIVEEQQGIHRVLLADARAQAAGVMAGQSANAALALLPTLALEERSLPREQQALEMLAGWLERLPGGGWLLDQCEGRRRTIAWLVVPLAVGLGIYTGVLLSAFSARPFWNSGMLGPLFLVSGLSTAAVLPLLAGVAAGEKRFFEGSDMALIAVELTLIGLFLISLATGAGQHLEALYLVWGGDYTVPFWLWFVLPGLLIPLLLEILALRGNRLSGLTAAVLVVFGAFMLRYLMVEIGQVSTWTDYAVQFDPQLLQRLMQ